MVPSALTTAGVRLWYLLEVLDEREARAVVCRLCIRRDLILEQPLEPSQVGAELLKLRDLTSDRR